MMFVFVSVRIMDNVLPCFSGADVDIEDNYGETAFSVSEHFGLKSCGFRLTQFNFQRRLKKKVDVCNSPLMPHQKNDSLYPVWKKGPMVGYSKQPLNTLIYVYVYIYVYNIYIYINIYINIIRICACMGS